MRPAPTAAPPPSPAAPPRPAERRGLDALPQSLATYAVDLDGRVTGAGGAAGHAHLVGTPVWDALADADARDPIERAMRRLRGGHAPAVQWEHRIGAADDAPVLLLHLAPRHDAGAAGRDPHAVTGFLLSTLDVSASHRAREALLDGAVALARALEPERVYAELAQQLARAVRGDACCVALADPAAPEAPDAAPPLRVVHQLGYDADAAALAARLADAWREAIAARRVVVRPADGGHELTAPLVDPAEGGSGVLGALTVRAAVDDPQRLNEATRALTGLAAHGAAAVARARVVQRLEQRRRLEGVGEVAAGVARELRHPLQGISSAAQLLRFRVPDDPVVERNIGRILREVERLNRTVTSLLEYGRPDAIRLEPGDPDAVWDAVLDAQRGPLEGKALLLDRTRPVGAPARVRLDAELLGQLFVNVLANAVDAAPEASDLALTSAVLADGGWRCRLHNGGPPIPADALPRVFDVFYSTRPGGTGIGLALCRRIADEHGGTIAIESAADAGTTVTITLPPA